MTGGAFRGLNVNPSSLPNRHSPESRPLGDLLCTPPCKVLRIENNSADLRRVSIGIGKRHGAASWRHTNFVAGEVDWELARCLILHIHNW